MADFHFDVDLVRTTMSDRGITRAELALAAGLTHASAVSKIFSGERQVKVEEAKRVYDFLSLATVESSATMAVPIIGLTAAGAWREAVGMPLGRMVIPSHVAGKHAFAVEVRGDSMNLLIEDGGWIVVDPDDHVLKVGKSYLIQNDEHGVTVKQYQTKPSRFEPVSDNPEHKAFEVTAMRYHILGRVVWKGAPV